MGSLKILINGWGFVLLGMMLVIRDYNFIGGGLLGLGIFCFIISLQSHFSNKRNKINGKFKRIG
jgi:hypothetical protein